MSAFDQTAPVLEVRTVSKTFVSGEHRVKALDSVSLKVMRGQCLAVVGESGSGKSTLANLLLGIHQPTTGDLYLDGNLLPGHRTLPLRRMIQFVQQTPLIFHLLRNGRQLMAASYRRLRARLQDRLPFPGAPPDTIRETPPAGPCLALALLELTFGRRGALSRPLMFLSSVLSPQSSCRSEWLRVPLTSL